MRLNVDDRAQRTKPLHQLRRTPSRSRAVHSRSSQLLPEHWRRHTTRRRSCRRRLIIPMILQTIRRDRSGSVQIDEPSKLSRPDRSGADLGPRRSLDSSRFARLLHRAAQQRTALIRKLREPYRGHHRIRHLVHNERTSRPGTRRDRARLVRQLGPPNLDLARGPVTSRQSGP